MYFSGSVAINQVNGAETLVVGVATKLYATRKAAARLPDPANKRGCVVTQAEMTGATTVQVDTTAGYLVGDTLSTLTYVDPTPVDGAYVAASVELKITAKTGTQFTFTPALPVNFEPPSGPVPLIKDGQTFGFTGSAGEWTAIATPQRIKILTQLAAQANADATALCDITTRAVTATGNLVLGDDVIRVGARGAPIVLTLPAGAPVGFEVVIYDFNNSATVIGAAAPGGETLVGVTAVTSAYGRLHLKKVSPTVWIGDQGGGAGGGGGSGEVNASLSGSVGTELGMRINTGDYEDMGGNASGDVITQDGINTLRSLHGSSSGTPVIQGFVKPVNGTVNPYGIHGAVTLVWYGPSSLAIKNRESSVGPTNDIVTPNGTEWVLTAAPSIPAIVGFVFDRDSLWQAAYWNAVADATL